MTAIVHLGSDGTIARRRLCPTSMEIAFTLILVQLVYGPCVPAFAISKNPHAAVYGTVATPGQSVFRGEWFLTPFQEICDEEKSLGPDGHVVPDVKRLITSGLCTMVAREHKEYTSSLPQILLSTCYHGLWPHIRCFLKQRQIHG